MALPHAWLPLIEEVLELRGFARSFDNHQHVGRELGQDAAQIGLALGDCDAGVEVLWFLAVGAKAGGRTGLEQIVHPFHVPDHESDLRHYRASWSEGSR